ncbi:MAG: hypothetical protein WC924_02795 [Candidatus Gracilibacteria bacterium]
MRTDTSEKIVAYIDEHKQAKPEELVRMLQISKQAVFKQLAGLLRKGIISKIGKAPKVLYILNSESGVSTGNCKEDNLSAQTLKLIEERYLYVSASGEKRTGLEGFKRWCEKTDQNVEKTAKEYVQTLRKYDGYKKNGLINGKKKFEDTFANVYLDEIFYVDFYSIERFGKTRLGQLLLYAKQSQNLKLIQELVEDIRSPIQRLIKKYNITAIGFIPPTVKREIQLMSELGKTLHLNLRKISITKMIGDIPVPQKTLSNLNDRIENAQKTIFVTEKEPAENILLIDDAVGSGATLNETAAKLRQQGLCTGKIIGVAITGSFKGFDVISEV